MTGRCAHRPGGCPLCDPRPITADRDAGCVCPPGRREVPLHLDSWRPAANCPVHFDVDPAPLSADDVDELFDPPTVGGREVQLEVDPELEPLLAALYGPTWRQELTAHAAEHLVDGQAP